MATAVTTGVIATVLQASNWSSATTRTASPRLTANAVKAMLQYTALPLRGDGAIVDELTQGVGARQRGRRRALRLGHDDARREP